MRTVAVLAATLALAGCIDVGTGEKLGYVTRVETSGMFCKTMEVQIQRGGMSAGTGAVGAAFEVTVTDPAMFKTLHDAMESQTEVKIEYRGEFATFCRSDSHDNFLTAVEVAKPSVKVVPISTPSPIDVKSVGIVKTAPASKAEIAQESHDEKVARLLKVQADLISELASEKK